jgi:hypothetical protein
LHYFQIVAVRLLPLQFTMGDDESARNGGPGPGGRHHRPPAKALENPVCAKTACSQREMKPCERCEA